MKELSFFEKYDSPVVIALGFFDCLHKGHLSLLERATGLAKTQSAEPCLFTFKNDMDVAFLANEILHLSCIYKEYSCDQKSDKLSAFLARNKTGIIPPADDPRNQFASIAFPSAKTACNGQDERPIINNHYVPYMRMR